MIVGLNNFICGKSLLYFFKYDFYKPKSMHGCQNQFNNSIFRSTFSPNIIDRKLHTGKRTFRQQKDFQCIKICFCTTAYLAETLAFFKNYGGWSYQQQSKCNVIQTAWKQNAFWLVYYEHNKLA